MNKIYHFDEITSTNDFLKENYKELENYSICTANLQTKGRGRMNRQWIGTKNENIAISILIKDLKGIKDIASITILAACSLHKFLSNYTEKLEIKWPNDLLYDGKKISGILTEGVSSSDCIEAIICGIGFNINQKVFPEELQASSISLSLITGKQYDLSSMRLEFAKILTKDVDEYLNGNVSYIDYMRKHLYAKGKMIKYYQGESIEEGKIIDIDNDGKLIIEKDNSLFYVQSGEIKIIR